MLRINLKKSTNFTFAGNISYIKNTPGNKKVYLVITSENGVNQPCTLPLELLLDSNMSIKKGDYINVSGHFENKPNDKYISEKPTLYNIVDKINGFKVLNR